MSDIDADVAASWDAEAAAPARWIDLLAPGGRLVLVEGRWSTGAGLDAPTCERLVREQGRPAVVRPLPDPAYWGKTIEDERYLVVSEAPGRP